MNETTARRFLPLLAALTLAGTAAAQASAPTPGRRWIRGRRSWGTSRPPPPRFTPSPGNVGASHLRALGGHL